MDPGALAWTLYLKVVNHARVSGETLVRGASSSFSAYSRGSTGRNSKENTRTKAPAWRHRLQRQREAYDGRICSRPNPKRTRHPWMRTATDARTGSGKVQLEACSRQLDLPKRPANCRRSPRLCLFNFDPPLKMRETGTDLQGTPYPGPNLCRTQSA